MRSIKLPSWQKTGFAGNVNDMFITCGHHNETVGVCHQRLLAFGPSLTSDLTLVSPANGRPDLASELPLIPRVKGFNHISSTSGKVKGIYISCVMVMNMTS